MSAEKNMAVKSTAKSPGKLSSKMGAGEKPAGAVVGASAASKGASEKTRNILGVEVCAWTRDEAFNCIESALQKKQHLKWAFLNAHGGNLAYKDATFLDTLKQFVVVTDGVGVDVGSKILYGEPFPANLHGSDFLTDLFSALQSKDQKISVGLIGAAPGIAQEVARRWAQHYPKHSFDVISHGFLKDQDLPPVLEQLGALRPDILLVAMGNPAQEKWIVKHCNADNCGIAFGVGALFDFTAGNVKRAPQFLQKIRMEWAYRLWLEPKRMWRRYVLGNPLFVLRVLRQKYFAGNRGQESRQ